jgi:hypothetical protein
MLDPSIHVAADEEPSELIKDKDAEGEGHWDEPGLKSEIGKYKYVKSIATVFGPDTRSTTFSD